VPIPDPFPVLLFQEGTSRALARSLAYPSGFSDTMNRPRYITPYPPLCPAPLSRTLCVSAFTVFTSTIQHLSTRSLPPLLRVACLPFSLSLPPFTLLLLLALNKNRFYRLRVICGPSVLFYFYVYSLASIYIFLRFPSFRIRPRNVPRFFLFLFFFFFFFPSLLRASSFIICLFANHLHMRIIVACQQGFALKAVNSLSALSLSPPPLCWLHTASLYRL